MPPAIHDGFFTTLRRDQLGRPALRFAGLDAAPVRQSLSLLYETSRASPSAIAAREAADCFQQCPDLLRQMKGIRQQVEAEATKPQQGGTFGDAFERSRTAIERAYSFNAEMQEIAVRLRAYNRIVNRVVGSLLGLAEEFEPLRLTECAGALGESISGGQRRIRLTTTDQLAGGVRPTHPAWIQMGTPLDGLYLVEGHTFAFGGSEEFDLHLVAFDAV